MLLKVFTRKIYSTVLRWFAVDNVQRIYLKACVFEDRTLEDSLVLSMVIASDRVRTMRAYCAAVTTELTRILRRTKRRLRRARTPRLCRGLSVRCPFRSSPAVSHRLETNYTQLNNTKRLFTLSNYLGTFHLSLIQEF